MTAKRQIPAVFTKGHALCSPDGKLQSKTFRTERDDAIAAKYRVKRTREQAWAKAQAKGWTVRLVYVRIFIPVFKSTYTTAEISHTEDDFN